MSEPRIAPPPRSTQLDRIEAGMEQLSVDIRALAEHLDRLVLTDPHGGDRAHEGFHAYRKRVKGGQ